MQTITHSDPEFKPYSLKELAGLYEVKCPVFKTWLKPFRNEIGVKQGWYFNPKQVRLIFEKLGVPSRIVTTIQND